MAIRSFREAINDALRDALSSDPNVILIGEDIAGIFQLDPVILDILTRGEMPVIAVIFARDMRQHAHLR
jgi:hypothetical protein